MTKKKEKMKEKILAQGNGIDKITQEPADEEKGGKPHMPLLSDEKIEKIEDVKEKQPFDDKKENPKAAAVAAAAEGGGATRSLADQLSHLSTQDITKLDPRRLTPQTLEVISRQPTINIGLIGHVAHGKSTVVWAISGVKTTRFHDELVRNITIQLGYANAKIYRAENIESAQRGLGNYCSKGSMHPDRFTENGRNWCLERHVSFVDCPGHNIYMTTMLSGAAVMDAVIVLVAGNEVCPQPQTSEHLAAVEIIKLPHIIILQNKVDLVKQEVAEAQQESIKKFVAGTVADGAPIIPISAVHKYNIDVVCEYIAKYIPVPVRDFTGLPKLIVIRSFDVNKPGQDVRNLRGGVAGGSILRGVLKLGDEIEIRPGIINKDSNGNIKCVPIHSKILSLFAEQNDLQYAVPGGLIGVGTRVDPTLTRADRLVGQVLGLKGHLPDVFAEIEVSYYLLRRLLGVKAQDGKKLEKVAKLGKKEMLMVNIGSTTTGCKVVQVKEGDSGRPTAKLVLVVPVCTQEGEKISLSRRIDKSWRLIGWGEIRRGIKIELNSFQQGSEIMNEDMNQDF